MRSAHGSVLGLIKELYSCVANFFRFMALKNQGNSLIHPGRFKSRPLFSDADSNG